MIASYTFEAFPDLIRSGIKQHTFRADPHRRWKPGMNIQHWWGSPRNPRSKPYEIQFDVVQSVWDVEIHNQFGCVSFVFDPTGGKHVVWEYSDVIQICKNDGLSVDQFRGFFVPNDNTVWNGRCICWTELNYFSISNNTK